MYEPEKTIIHLILIHINRRDSLETTIDRTSKGSKLCYIATLFHRSKTRLKISASLSNQIHTKSQKKLHTSSLSQNSAIFISGQLIVQDQQKLIKFSGQTQISLRIANINSKILTKWLNYRNKNQALEWAHRHQVI